MRALLTAFLIFLAPVAQAKTEVDLELVLMVDVSRSMSPAELEIQRRGYAEAFMSDQVWEAVQSGLLQRVAVTYVEWAGTQRMIVDWTLLEDREDLIGFAQTLATEFNPALRRTSISEALIYAAESLNNNEFKGLRRVIDISGDGPNNQGRLVTRARDAVLEQGIVINGLPLLTRDGLGSSWHLDGLDLYYEACVIGGPGSFVIPVLDWTEFADAVKRKLVLEMVGLTPPARPRLAQLSARDPTDCRIGEKMWEERRMFWGDP